MENTPTHRSSKTAAALMAAAALMPLGLCTTANAESLVEQEIARRIAQVAEADAAIEVGRKAYTKRNYEKAVENYRKAINILPTGPIAADRRQSYIGHLVDGSIALSAQYRRTGRTDEARELLDSIIARDPGNVLAKKHLEYLDDPIRTSPTLTYEHVQNTEKVGKLLYRAGSYFDQAQFDQAQEEYKEVLRIDPYNQAARRGMQRVSNAKSDYYRAAYDQTRAQMLEEVDAAWETTIPPLVPITIPGEARTDFNKNPALLLRNKLQRIQLTNVEFTDDTTVRQAINFLRLRARELDDTELDPGSKGINFVFRDRSVAADPGLADLEGGDDGAFDDANKIENIKLGELVLRNVPLEEALKQICSKTGLRFKVENFSVVILRAGDVTEAEMFTKSFRVPPDFRTLIADGSGTDGGSDDPFSDDTGETAQPSVQEQLVKSGVPFPEGSSATFSKARSILTVRNTANNLDILEQIVNDFINIKPKQIKISTKFVEISQNNTDELGFDFVFSPFGLNGNALFLGGGTTGNGATRTATDFGSAPGGAVINGIPAVANQAVSNISTAGLRSGDFGLSADSIDAFLDDPLRLGTTDNVAPGILSLTGLFTDGQVQLIMRGLAQKQGADIMTAPSIVSRSGERAVIEIIREFIYPTEYDPPELPNNFGGGGNGVGTTTITAFPVTPATPTAFETRNTGVLLEVEPTLGEDGFTIDLQFTPEIVEFDGFINYGSPIQTTAADALGNPVIVTITDNRIEMPVFSTRRVNTALTIYDGHTVAVGGLITEDVQTIEDKVPILGDLPLVGRLFQTNSESHAKSNLIIFVSANIIDATGQLVRNGSVIANDGVPTSLDNSGVLPVISN